MPWRTPALAGLARQRRGEEVRPAFGEDRHGPGQLVADEHAEDGEREQQAQQEDRREDDPDDSPDASA